MALIGILIIIIGFTLRFNSIAVVIVSGVVTGLIADMSISEILLVIRNYILMIFMLILINCYIK